ncbi:MAG: hypothetical protein U9R00_01830 [Patescibacteria group bacterium]|nr:hypothetical protein [Patescibacteria group bacterium]
MKFFNRKEKMPQPKVVEKDESKVVEEEKYEPELGEVNRYENALNVNKDLAKEINEKAKIKAERALILLAELEESPEKANFHSKQSGRKWNIHHLQNEKKELLKLYGVFSMEMLERHASTKPPKETLEFEQRLETFMREQNPKG